jgi:hypothetical protein
MENIKWQRGNFLKFFAKMKIRVGGTSTPIDINKDDEFEYDGSILKYAGMEIAQPQMRGAISNGWAVLDLNSDSTIESIKPTRSIAKAQTINRDLNRVQRSLNAAVETTSLDEDEVLRVSDRSEKASPKVITANDNRRARGMSVSSDANDDQGAVTIGRVKTSAKQEFVDVSKPDAANKIRELENMSNVRADLDKSNTITREGVTIKTNVGNVSRIAAESESDGVQIGKVRHTSSGTTEGVTITDTSNIREERKAVKPAPAKVSKKLDTSLNPRIRVARSIFPDFPADWVFEGKLADRLAAVKSANPTPEFLEALFAAEGDQFRKVLIKEYPDQFSA